MWSTANKAALAVSVAVMISGLGLMVYAYSRSQYYQGRIDAKTELISEFEKIRNEYFEKHSDMDEGI